MNQFTLPIFPDGSLASSVITTVWVGVCVVCLLNLRFGWVLSGLVVPGYLVPLLIAKPLSALIVVAEASLTYLIFWLISERLAAPSRWSSFFGRDRFMGLILVSVAVRLMLDGWLLPIAADLLSDRYGLELDWQHNLHSFGLIVVALLANQIWKPGYVRGMAHALVMTGATYLIVRYGLMEFTNFRIGAVVYLYEDFASSILASPKAYIILISTCLIASRMNLRYGWDFSGILIPALLALQWYQPWKILTSFVEALIVYLLAIWLLSSRLFASATVEGGRKVLLFFNISFAYKLILGHALAWAGTEQRISDYYGFGYLLPTLIAIKAHDKSIWTRLTRATLQVSLLGVSIGSAAGFALTLLIPASTGRATAAPAVDRLRPTAARFVAESIGAARIAEARGEWRAISLTGAPSFRAAIDMINGGRRDAEVSALLREAGYRLQPLSGGELAFREEGGSVAFIFNPAASRSLALMVPQPTAVPGLGLAALSIFGSQRARWLVIGGTAQPLLRDAGSSAPTNEFVRALPISRLQIVAAPVAHSKLDLAESMSSYLDLGRLRQNQPDLEVGFADYSGNEVSRMRLSARAIRKLLEDTVPTPRNLLASQLDDRELSPAALAFVRFDLVDPLLANGAPWVVAGRATAAAVGLELGASTASDGQLTLSLRRYSQPSELYLLRPSAAGPVILSNSGQGLDPLARKLFESFKARALLQPPTADLGQDPLQALLNLAVQPPEGGQTIQLRSWSPGSDGAAVAHVYAALDRLEPPAGFGDQLVASLRRIGVDARLVDRGAATAGLEIGPDPHFRYLRQARGGKVAVLWVARGKLAP